MSVHFRLCSILLFAALLVVTTLTPVFGALPETLGDDFKPLSGYVIMPSKGEFLVDLDAAKGVRVGDIFVSVSPGQKIVHPVTKEVLGTLDEVKGILQISRLRSGYSHARAVVGGESLQRGDLIRRYENIPVTFWDFTGGGEGVYSELKATLPALEWPDYQAAQAQKTTKPQPPAEGGPLLIFALKDTGLEVLDFTKKTLKAYPFSSAQVNVPLPSQVIAPVLVPDYQAGAAEVLQYLAQP